MGSDRIRSLGPTQTTKGARPPRAARPRLHPVSTPEPGSPLCAGLSRHPPRDSPGPVAPALASDQQSRHHAPRTGTPSPPIYWNRSTTAGPCRNSAGTRMSRRQWCAPTGSTGAAWASAVPWMPWSASAGGFGGNQHNPPPTTVMYGNCRKRQVPRRGTVGGDRLTVSHIWGARLKPSTHC